MLGSIRRDMPIQDRMLPNEAPYSTPLVQNTMRQNMLTNRPMGSARLNGLYNTSNMPVVMTRAGSSIRVMRPLGGVKNNSLAQIQFPKRMPYDIVPR